MMREDKKQRKRQLLLSLRRYLLFFLFMSFIITCCMLLFLHIASAAMDLTLTKEGIKHAARLTFFNILLLSLICTFIDGIRRKSMVERPVKQIVTAADRIMKGDFSARIQPVSGSDYKNEFDVIIDYFNKMAVELSGMETLRSDFISNVSHELKTPLAVIQNYGILLQQPGLSEDKRLEYAKAVAEGSRRLADLVTNILKLNKLENQQIYPGGEAYNLGEQLCECLLGFENVWQEKNLEIETDIEEDVFVALDEELLAVVWNNLFSNAVKFTEPKGKLFLGLRTTEESVIVRIADTGCGISPEVGKHIFEKFYQGDTSHATQGNGLGLALVKRVIDIIGGEISVESKVGTGTAFTVTLRRGSYEKVQTDSE